MGTAARKKIPDNIPATAMRAQPHGGALKTGGPNRGAGRPPGVLRELARGITEETLPHLRLIALGEQITVTRATDGAPAADVQVRAEVAERFEAFDRITKLGLGEEVRTEDVRKRLERQAEIIVDTLGVETAQRVLTAIAEAWG